MNGNRIGAGYSREVYDTLSIQTTLYLKAEDEVWVQIIGGFYLRDISYHRTHFTGWLLEEDLSFY